jgi:hypothetical protein
LLFSERGIDISFIYSPRREFGQLDLIIRTISEVTA